MCCVCVQSMSGYCVCEFVCVFASNEHWNCVHLEHKALVQKLDHRWHESKRFSVEEKHNSKRWITIVIYYIDVYIRAVSWMLTRGSKGRQNKRLGQLFPAHGLDPSISPPVSPWTQAVFLLYIFKCTKLLSLGGAQA